MLRRVGDLGDGVFGSVLGSICIALMAAACYVCLSFTLRMDVNRLEKVMSSIKLTA